MDQQATRIIAGLGNPGERYQGTRHNIGFMVADRVAERLGCDQPQAKFSGLTSDCRLESGRLVVLKPLTFMNRSGQSVSAAARWFKVDLDSLLIVYDDLDLPFGEVRLRRAGSPAGHNGLSSVIDHFGTREVPRLRVGIDRPSGRDTTSYVLSRFGPEEAAELPSIVDHAADAALEWLERGIDAAMGKFNGINVLATPE